MLIGHTIVAEQDNPTEVYTNWFPRMGDALTSTFEAIAINGMNNARVTVDVFHKNSEDTGQGAAVTVASGTNNLTAVSRSSFRCETIKELIRFRIKLEHLGGAVNAYAHFRVLMPSWEVTGA